MGRFLLIVLMTVTVTFAPAMAAPRVVVTIKPIHSIAAALMAGIAEPDLLLPDDVSPHDFSLRPSQARLLEKADIVIWVGPELEVFLIDTLSNLAPRAKTIEVMAESSAFLRTQRGRLFLHKEASGSPRICQRSSSEDDALHDHDHDTENETGCDPHLWLDPIIMKAFARELSREFAVLDPANASVYEDNYDKLADALTRLDAALNADLKKLQGKNFIVFHDAYQYFAARYKLSEAAAVHIDPDEPLSRNVIISLQETVAAEDIECVFSEPQFPPEIIDAIIEDTAIKKGQTDPLGEKITAGPAMYTELMRTLARDMQECLMP